MQRTARPLARNPTGEHSTAVVSVPLGSISPQTPPRIVAVGNKRVAVSDKFDFSHYDPVRSAGCFSGQPFGPSALSTSTKTPSQYERHQGLSGPQILSRGVAPTSKKSEACTNTRCTQTPSKKAKHTTKPFILQNAPSHLPNGVPISIHNGGSPSVPDEQLGGFEPPTQTRLNGPGSAPLVPAMGTEYSTVSFSQHRHNIVRTTWDAVGPSRVSEETYLTAIPRQHLEEPRLRNSFREDSSRYAKEVDSRIMIQMPIKMRRLQAERDEIADKLKEARAELKLERQEASDCRTNTQDLTEKYEELHRQHDALKLQHDTLKLQQWETEQKLKKLEREGTKTCKDNGYLKMQNEKLKKENEGFKRDNTATKKENTMLKRNYKTSVTEKEGLQKKIDELQRALGEKETQKQKLEKELSVLTGKLGDIFREACRFGGGPELQEDSETQIVTQSIASILAPDEPQNQATNNTLQQNQNGAPEDAPSDSGSTVAPSEAETASGEFYDRAEISDPTASGRQTLILKLAIGRDGMAKFQETN